VVVSATLAVVAFVVTRYFLGCTREVVTGLSLVAGVAGGIVGSYLTQPPSADQIEQFFKKIYVPIGQEERLRLPLAEVVPPAQRLLTGGGLFIVRPSRQSWVGFLVTLAIVVGAVLFMMVLLQ